MKIAIPSLILLSATLLVADETLTTASHVMPEKGGYFSSAAGMATNGVVFDNRKAQVFKAEASGTLDKISIVVRRTTSTTADLRVSLTTVENQEPSQVLVSSSIAVDSVPIEAFGTFGPTGFTATASFAMESISLHRGRDYAILLSTDTVEANYRVYGNHHGYRDGYQLSYQDGQLRDIGINSDLFFDVNVRPLIGDVNLDGEVGFLDFLILSNNFGRQTSEWRKGDFNGDHMVDFEDFLVLSANFGNAVMSASAPAATVPEPTGLSLISLFGILGLIGFRKLGTRTFSGSRGSALRYCGLLLSNVIEPD